MLRRHGGPWGAFSGQPSPVGSPAHLIFTFTPVEATLRTRIVTAEVRPRPNRRGGRARVARHGGHLQLTSPRASASATVQKEAQIVPPARCPGRARESRPPPLAPAPARWLPFAFHRRTGVLPPPSPSYVQRPPATTLRHASTDARLQHLITLEGIMHHRPRQAA
ncbi:hypothetical protein PCL_02409 [Purpureocillium lilacinum]|uniref:Uncharacterized protein n=1 Tax=Purpureocillium lilacinum TaxID=33203 RepID=A0A2U3E0G5_PURLI|nr:hypothetical protein PCL_02409 [Purpureocillium lilacinum]